MCVDWPQFVLRRFVRQVAAEWEGGLRPSHLSSAYQMRLRLDLGRVPRAWVLSPKLEIRPGYTDLPHVYKDGSLCVQEMEWRDWMYIAEYVPWVSAWLLFYEVWSATGLWLGGGTHPEKPEHRSE